jgi:hypothetical protein
MCIPQGTAPAQVLFLFHVMQEGCRAVFLVSGYYFFQAESVKNFTLFTLLPPQEAIFCENVLTSSISCINHLSQHG